MSAFNHTDLSTFTTEQLIQELDTTRAALELEESKHLDCDQYVRRALQLRVTEVRRWIAIHNTRATAAIEGMPEERLLAIQLAIGGLNNAATIPEVMVDVPRSVLVELLEEVRRLRGEPVAR